MGSILATCDDLTSGPLPRICRRGSPKGPLYVAELHNASWSLDGLTRKSLEQVRHGDTSTGQLLPLNGHPPPALIQGQTLTQMYLALY